jgi:predicted transcriptional regulator
MKLKDYLKEMKIRPIDFARTSGLTGQTILNIIHERGLGCNFRLDTLIRVSKASDFYVMIDDLMGTKEIQKIRAEISMRKNKEEKRIKK